MRYLLYCLFIPILGFADKTSSQKTNQAPAWDANLFSNHRAVVSPHVEFLYWKVQEGSLDYALKMQRPAWGPSNAYAQGKYKTGSFDIDPGFRISLSYFRAPKEWEVWGSYTRLTSHGYDSASKPTASTQYLTGTWPQTFSAPLNGATSSTHLNYNVADALANRYFHPNPHLRLRLLGGLTSAWISQNWVVQYTDAAQERTRIQNQWKFAGGGFRFGVMADWYWAGDIYLTARGTFGALMGCYKNQSKQTTTFAVTGADNAAIPIRDATYRDGRGAITMQASLGPSWQKCYPSARVEVFTGYEINTWTNLQEIYRSTAAGPTAAKEIWVNTSLLSIQGLTTRLTVDF